MTTSGVAITELPFSKNILEARAYTPEWLGLDRANYLRLDRNESTRPIPVSVAERLVQYIAQRGVHSYPEAERLAVPLAHYCGVPPECVFATNGSDQAIDLSLRSFLSEGARMLVARPEFSIFGHIAAILGAHIVGVPYHDNLDFPYREFREAAALNRPDLIVIINPNNPTGTPVRREFIEELAITYPRVPLVVDEAYYEYTGESAVELTHSHDNVVVLRTFSKAFSMAGLRLGYIVAAPAVAAQIVKLRNPFDVNELAVVTGEAQLRDPAPMQAHVDEVMNQSKPTMIDFFQSIKIPIFPGTANFMLVKPERCPEVVDFLYRHGILVRSMSAPSLRGMFRVSMGAPLEMTEFIRVFQAYLQAGAS